MTYSFATPLKALAAALALSCAVTATAAESVTVRVNGQADPAVMAMLSRLRQLYPSTVFKEISTTPLPGIFQVVMGRNVAFVDDSGRYFLFGHLFDMREQRDLTEEATAASPSTKVDFGALPVKDAIVTTKGSGARKLAVFIDPDCPYCRQFENTLAKLTDVTVYTFLFPLEALHPDAKRKSVGVWCAADRAKAWDDLMLRGMESRKACDDTPIDRNLKLAESLGINGTPTLVFPNGQVLPGSPRAEHLEQLLGAAK